MGFVPIMMAIAGCFGAVLLVLAVLYMLADATYNAYHERDIAAALAFSGIWLICVSAGLYQLYIWSNP